MTLRSGNCKTPINSLYSRKRYRNYMKAVLVFRSYVKEQKENSEVGAPVIPFRKVLKGALPQRGEYL